MSVCQNSAIYKDEKLNRNVIDPNKCIGCKMCFSACPFGAIGFDSTRGYAYKCDYVGAILSVLTHAKKSAINILKAIDLNQ